MDELWQVIEGLQSLITELQHTSITVQRDHDALVARVAVLEAKNVELESALKHERSRMNTLRNEYDFGF